MSQRPREKQSHPVIPSSRGQDCLLTEVRAARAADVAKMLTELKGRDSTISFLWMRALGEGKGAFALNICWIKNKQEKQV